MSNQNETPGWFDFSALYNRAVEDAPYGAWLVEIGVYHGASLRHLATMAKAADKNLTVVGIDWCRGSPEHRDHVATLPFTNLAGPLVHNLITAGIADDCALIVAPSVRAAKFIPDGSCSFVFIDGDHSPPAVTADIGAFLPKVMKGGVLAGHDYFSDAGVRTAVHKIFGLKDLMSRSSSSCWEVRI